MIVNFDKMSHELKIPRCSFQTANEGRGFGSLGTVHNFMVTSKKVKYTGILGGKGVLEKGA